MVFKNKKSISEIIAVSLLLVVAVISTIQFSNWFSGFQSNILSNVESKNLMSNSEIISIDGNYLYFKNDLNNQVVKQIKINGDTCNFNLSYSNLSIGMNKIDLNYCHENITNPVFKVLLVTNSRVYSKTLYFNLGSLVKVFSCRTDNSTGFYAGNGSVENPYQICNCIQLQNMSNHLTSSFLLVSDINCSDTINWNSGAGFIPIGDNSNHFSGDFNGNFYNITGLYINNSGNSYSGLFGYIDYSNSNDKFLKNLFLYYSNNLYGGSQTGGLVGYLYGSSQYNTIIANITVSIPNIYSSDYVGGLIGYFDANYQDKIILTNLNSNVGLINGSSYIGGLIGNYKALNQTNVNLNQLNSNISNINGSSYIGGLMGQFYTNYQKNIILSNFESNVTYLKGGYSIGGLIGYFISENQTNISFNFLKSNVNNLESSDQSTGGLVGYFNLLGQLNVNFNNFYSNIEVLKSSTNEVGGLIGTYSAQRQENITFNIMKSTITNLSGALYVGGLIGKYYASNQTNVSLFNLNSNLNQLDSTDGGVGGLIGYSSIEDQSNIKFKNLSASFNSLDSLKSNVGGLFGVYSANGQENIVFDNLSSNFSNMEGTYYVGGLIGYYIADNQNNVSLIGLNSHFILLNTSDASVGGLIGFYSSENQKNINFDKLYSIITNISGTNSVGGLIGNFKVLNQSNVNFTNAYSIVDNINGTYHLGGLFGYFNGPTQKNILINNVYSRVYSLIDTRDNNHGGLFGKIYLENSNGPFIINNSFSIVNNLNAPDYYGVLIGYQSYVNSSNILFDNIYMYNGTSLPAFGFDASSYNLPYTNKSLISDFYGNSNLPMSNWNTSIWNFYSDKLPTLK